ncbi:hypothetical protein [Legionella sp. W05-934-2]|uniref:acylneuraminate cytidylyltransferase family protein n=1 Tax=Legionella sp. W05-934-2 TaxID=1198649 RepID=UPI003463804F
MIGQKKIVALIPLRGGSKSIKNKNLALLGGKPLLAWPIETAQAIPEIDKIIVSTDNDAIKRASESYGAEVHDRPAHLATDEAVVADVIRYTHKTLMEIGETYDYMILLEATSPFRDKHVIQTCLKRLEEEDLDSIATFNEAEINPHRTWEITEGIPQPFIKGAIPWLSRQKLPKAFQLNGAMYAFNLKTFPKDGPNVLYGKMGAEIINSDSVIDIDTKKDLVIANAILDTRELPETV